MHSENWQALNSLQKRYRGKVKCIYIDPPFNLGTNADFAYKVNYRDSSWATLLENRVQLARDFLGDAGNMFVRCDYHGNWIVRCILDVIFGKENFRNEIVIAKTKEFFKTMKNLKQFAQETESLFYFSKRNKCNVFNELYEKKKETFYPPFFPTSDGDYRDSRIINGKKHFSPKGRKWGVKQEDIEDLLAANELVEKDGAFLLRRDKAMLKNNWVDVQGYARKTGFSTENSEHLLARVIECSSNKGDVVLDFFMGSGTTQAVAQKLGRKWLGVELGSQFHEVVLPRMKRVVFGEQSGASKKLKEKYFGGGAFKYHGLEQYEQTLKNARYSPSQHLELDSAKSPFAQYAFFGDDKLAHIVTVKNDKLQIDLHKLYADIDIAESLANILGKTIRKRTTESVTFADGSAEKINPATMTEDEKRHFVALIKPYLWWGN